MQWFFSLFITFVIYSIVGYIVEVIFCSIITKKVADRGFLLGPWIPIYGVGAVLMVILLNNYKSDPIVVFIFGMLITSVVEYFTSFIMEKIFHNRWWDYSDRKDSINGRICLMNAILFGFAAVIIVCWLNPILVDFINIFDANIINIVGSVLLLLFIMDCIYSIIVAYELRHHLIVVEELKKDKLENLSKILENSFKKKSFNRKIKSDRLVKAFPKLAQIKEMEIIKDFFKKQKIDKQKR